MTTPTERTRAVIQTGTFLTRLLYPRLTPRVPAEIREEARRLLRHYPKGFGLMRTGEAFDANAVPMHEAASPSMRLNSAPLPATPARGLPACGAERERGGED